MVVVRLFQGALINAWQTQAGLISIVLLLLFAIGVVVWGVIDGRADAAGEPGPGPPPGSGDDLAAGRPGRPGCSAARCPGSSRCSTRALYTGGLINELTTFAAFTALLVFLPAIIGVAIGRWLVDRQLAHTPQSTTVARTTGDTDVFAAVRADEAPTAGGCPAASARNGPRRRPPRSPPPNATNPPRHPHRWPRGAHRNDPHHRPRRAPTEVIRTDTEATRPHQKPKSD